MPRRIFTFDPPDRFAAGAVGEPGHRTFYLQAISGQQVVSVVLEKVQVAALAERLGEILNVLRGRGVDAPEDHDAETGPVPTLDEPPEELFRVGTLTLAWDPGAERIVIEAREMREREGGGDEADAADSEDDDDVPDSDPTGPDLVRVRISPTMADTFVRRALRVVAAGRPPCPMCGQPLDPQGHLCPRRNGHGAAYVH
jgi:uncharacterized repeat protein (TIGR03847 family)